MLRNHFDPCITVQYVPFLTSNTWASLLDLSSSTKAIGRPFGMGMVARIVALSRETSERTVCAKVLLNISIFPTSSITITGGAAEDTWWVKAEMLHCLCDNNRNGYS